MPPLFRYAKKFRLTYYRATQSIRIIFVWKCQFERSQPIADEHQRLNLLEVAPGPVVSQDNSAALALASSGEDLREWNDPSDNRYPLSYAALFRLQTHTF